MMVDKTPAIGDTLTSPQGFRAEPAEVKCYRAGGGTGRRATLRW